MTRNYKDETSQRGKNRYTDLCLTTKEGTGKENLILPAISIKPMRILQKKGKQKSNSKNLSATKSRVTAMLKESRDRIQKLNTSIQTTMNRQIVDDSFSTGNDNADKNLTKFMKKKLLPPIDMRSTSHPASPPQTFKSEWAEKSKSKKRLRVNTHCKVIMERNNMFPFHTNKKGSRSTKERQQTNNEEVSQFFDFGASKISQISVREDCGGFISEESAKEIPIL